MNLANACMKELSRRNLFENLEHRNRFLELIQCYSSYPFFRRGLCKCMYLSSWDMEHFLILLDMLNFMTINRSQTLEDMKSHGEVLTQQSTGYERYVMELSACFLEDTTYEIPNEKIDADGLYIIHRALDAADAIDFAFDEYEFS